MKIILLAVLLLAPSLVDAQKYTDANGRLRVALAKQPFLPTGTSPGPNTMANGGIQEILAKMGAVVRVDKARLTPEEDTEYGGWKRLSMALGHFAGIVAKNERDGYFTVGLLATCPSMPGLVAGLQHSGPTREPIKIGMLWLDAHPDINTPETTRSGSLGGMPVAVATGRTLQRMRVDAGLDPPLSDRHIVMGGVRLTDPLEQQILDDSFIEQLRVEDLRNMTPAFFAQLDRLSRLAFTAGLTLIFEIRILRAHSPMRDGRSNLNSRAAAMVAGRTFVMWRFAFTFHYYFTSSQRVGSVVV